MTQPDPPSKASYYCTGPKWVRLGYEEGRHRLLDCGSGKEQRIDDKFYRILTCFRLPSTLEAAHKELGLADFKLELEQLERAVEILVAEGLLRAEGVGEGFEPGRRGLFSSRFCRLAEALNDATITDVVVGFPYDLGCSNRPGSRLAPDRLRVSSPQLFASRANYDPVRGRRVLEDRRLADLGNLSGTVFQSNGRGFDRLQKTVSLIVDSGRRPVILGGDHSLTFAGLSGALERLGRVQLVQFDAHSDFAGPTTGDWRTEMHHGNFVSWVLEDERVEKVIQVGVRQLVAGPEEHPRLVSFPGLTALEQDWWRSLGEAPVYLTLDVDCLDPSYFDSTGTPVPGGFTPRELIRLLEQIPRSPAVIDLVELLPGRESDTLTACEVLLRALDLRDA